MTFLCTAFDFDSVVNDESQSHSVGSEFVFSSAALQRINIRRLPEIQIEIATPRHLSQIERAAMDRAFWRSVTVLDEGSEG